VYKKELRSLKRINATPHMRRVAQRNKLAVPIKYINSWGTYKSDTIYDIMIRCQTRGRILMIAVFFPDKVAEGIKTPTYEIYCNPEGSEFVTRILDEAGNEVRWSTGLFVNLDKVQKSLYRDYGLSTIQRNSRVWQNQGGRDTIRQFLRVIHRGIDGLNEYQGKCRDQKIQEAEAKEQKPWDEHMALIPPLLPGFERWAFHEAAVENFIFYESIKDKTGYCTYCEKQVPLIQAKRNKEGKCPCCGKTVKFKLQSKIQTLATEARYVECIQEIQGGFVIRTFRVSSYYRDRKYTNPHHVFAEQERVLYFGNTPVHYTWGNYKNKKHRFILEGRPYYSFYSSKHKLYMENIENLKRTVLKNTAIDLWSELPRSAAEYLYIERHNPAIEMLAKIGMFRLAKDVMSCRYDSTLLSEGQTQIAKILKIDNARLKRLKDLDGGIHLLKWLQCEKRADTIWPDYVISEFAANEINLSDFGFLPPPIKPVKVYNYIKRQAEKSGETFIQTGITWRDYYNLAEQNKWNVSASQIGWPKDLKKAHADAVLFSKGESIKKQSEKLEKKWPEVNKILPDIKKFEYHDKKFAVVAPTSIEDMVREGTALNHCMDHADFYYDRIQKHEAYPFFLRRTNSVDTPWYTLEVEASGNIRQKRTTGDNQNPDLEEALPFLKRFMAAFKKKMTAEERRQGETANEKRIQEYRELRKNGNRIWHGKLAGQLLADVLEADFMGLEE